MWFETHAHLSDPKFDEDRDAVLERAFSAGLTTIVEIADGPAEWPKAQALAEKYPDRVFWAAGLHPYFADQSTPDLWKCFDEMTRHPQFVAVGEIGLDYAKCPIPHDVQKAAFFEGLKAAERARKPVIIHCRDAYHDLMPILRNGSGPLGVVHCFSGNAAHAQELTRMGFFLGVDGPITYPSAKLLREAIGCVPLDRLVLETDSPYLPPQTHRGQRNEPSHLPKIGEQIATLFQTPTQKVAAITAQNAQRLFRLKNPLN